MKKFWLVMLVALLSVGFMFTSCEKDPVDNEFVRVVNINLPNWNGTQSMQTLSMADLIGTGNVAVGDVYEYNFEFTADKDFSLYIVFAATLSGDPWWEKATNEEIDEEDIKAGDVISLSGTFTFNNQLNNSLFSSVNMEFQNTVGNEAVKLSFTKFDFVKK